MSTFPNVPDEAWGVPNRRDSASFHIWTRPYDLTPELERVIVLAGEPIIRTGFSRSVAQEVEQLDYVEAVIRVGASSVEFVAKLEDMTDAAQKVISYIGEAFGLRPDDDVTVKVHTNLADNIVVAEGGSVTFDWPGTEPRDGLALRTDVSLD